MATGSTAVTERKRSRIACCLNDVLLLKPTYACKRLGGMFLPKRLRGPASFRGHAGTPPAWSADCKNPKNWSKSSKWLATVTACYMSSLVSVAASAYSQAVDGISSDLHTPHLVAVSGISFFTIAVAIFPLFLAPLGENYGRQTVYLTSYALFFLFFLPTALARNAATVLVSRFICGAAGSVGSTMVGGTLSDLWEQKDRELPMALFALSALLGTPLGLIVFTWAGGEDVSWRWIFWTLLAAAIPSASLIALFFRRETLPVQARQRLATSKSSAPLHPLENKSEGQRTSTSPSPPPSKKQHFRQAIIKSAFRPIHFLCTEPITLALSTWIAFAWGVLYLFLESVPLVFAPYGFTHDNQSRGLSFCGSAIGTLLGCVTHVTYIKRFRAPPSTPEQRLPEACFGATLFAAGFFIFAWTAKPGAIPWIVPQIGTAIIMMGMFMVYICIFDYLADCYGVYSSSAIAAQSFLRNILATGEHARYERCTPTLICALALKHSLSLRKEVVYNDLTYPWASSLLGLLALILAAVPFVLYAYGRALRERSAFATANIAANDLSTSAAYDSIP